MSKIISVMLLLLLIYNSLLNAADFMGKVVFSEDNSPVGFVTILINGDGTMLQTDENGVFNIKNVNGSSATATITHIGYSTSSSLFLP
ncbi:MAG: carboxypeptidase-like regulatory domain-containing protein [bacterium]